MMQQETGGLKESEDGTVEPGTPTKDEEITIPSQDRNRKILDFSDTDIRDEQTGCYLMSPCMGLARDRPVGKALR